MVGDCFGRGYSRRLNYFSIRMLINISTYVTAHRDLLRPSILFFGTIDFLLPILTLECYMPLVPRLMVGKFMLTLSGSSVRPHKWKYITGGLGALFPAFGFFSVILLIPPITLVRILSRALTVFSKAVIFLLHTSTNYFKVFFASAKLASFWCPWLNWMKTFWRSSAMGAVIQPFVILLTWTFLCFLISWYAIMK